MNRFLSVFLLFVCYGCMSNNYQYYVDKGDRIIDDSYSDSLHVQYLSKDLCVFKETIIGESGDFINEHIQYYDENKRLVAYKRVSKFFNSVCYDGVLEEETLYAVSGKCISMEKHTFHKEDGSLFEDTLDCIFNYRFKYELSYEFPPASLQSRVDSITLLKKAYYEKDYESFLTLFPNSFPKFLEYYGFVGDEPMPLYSVAFEHIEFLKSGEKSRLIGKLFDLAKNAIWDADAPNYLQKAVIELILIFPDEILSLLKEEENKIVENFWYFILYYPSLGAEYDLGYQKRYQQLYFCISEKDKLMGEVVKGIYNRIIVESR